MVTIEHGLQRYGQFNLVQVVGVKLVGDLTGGGGGGAGITIDFDWFLAKYLEENKIKRF